MKMCSKYITGTFNENKSKLAVNIIIALLFSVPEHNSSPK